MPRHKGPNENQLFNIKLQDIFLRTYRNTHSIRKSCDSVTICRKTYERQMAKDPEFRALKESLDIEDIELTRNSLRDSAHGYNKDEIKEEQEWDPISKKMVITRRTLTTRHYPPAPSSLVFKLCNEDPENYKNVNRVEGKVTVDETQKVIHGLDDKTIAELAKAIVKSKAAAGK